MKSVELHLPIFKQGDDLSWHIGNADNNNLGLLNYATTLEDAAMILKEVEKVIGNNVVEIYADTHHIGIVGPDEVINVLLERELAIEDPFEEEDEDWEDDVFLEDEDNEEVLDGK